MAAWKLGYVFRRFLAKRIFAFCGDGVIVKQHAYFGDRRELRVGHALPSNWNDATTPH
jgi:hypothetical protein